MTGQHVDQSTSHPPPCAGRNPRSYRRNPHLESDEQIRALEPADRDVEYFSERCTGLSLAVRKKADAKGRAKVWFLRYRRRRVKIGWWPNLQLAAAEAMASKLRETLDEQWLDCRSTRGRNNTTLVDARGRRMASYGEFTQDGIAKMEVRERSYDVADPGFRGLYARIMPSGIRYWVFRGKAGDVAEKVVFGQCDRLSLVDARLWVLWAWCEIRRSPIFAALPESSSIFLNIYPLALTNSVIDTFNPRARDYWLQDTLHPDLMLLFYTTGTRSWKQIVVANRRARTTIGQYPSMDAAKARAQVERGTLGLGQGQLDLDNQAEGDVAEDQPEPSPGEGAAAEQVAGEPGAAPLPRPRFLDPPRPVIKHEPLIVPQHGHRARLTDAYVHAAMSGLTRYTIRDTEVIGLGVRVEPLPMKIKPGYVPHKSFVYEYANKYHGKHHVSFRPFEYMTVDEARDRVRAEKMHLEDRDAAKRGKPLVYDVDEQSNPPVADRYVFSAPFLNGLAAYDWPYTVRDLGCLNLHVRVEKGPDDKPVKTFVYDDGDYVIDLGVYGADGLGLAAARAIATQHNAERAEIKMTTEPRDMVNGEAKDGMMNETVSGAVAGEDEVSETTRGEASPVPVELGFARQLCAWLMERLSLEPGEVAEQIDYRAPVLDKLAGALREVQAELDKARLSPGARDVLAKLLSAAEESSSVLVTPATWARVPMASVFASMPSVSAAGLAEMAGYLDELTQKGYYRVADRDKGVALVRIVSQA